MKVAIAICLLVAVGFACAGVVVPSTTLVRTPSLDSAIIKSDRLGGNFAYSTVEGHAYTAVSPVVQRVVAPVGVSYTAHQVPLGYAAAPIAYPQIWGGVVAAQPSLISGQQIFANPALNLGSPILSGLPIADAPVAPINQPSFIPAPAAPAAPAISSDSVISDEDTVSIESA